MRLIQDATHTKKWTKLHQNMRNFEIVRQSETSGGCSLSSFQSDQSFTTQIVCLLALIGLITSIKYHIPPEENEDNKKPIANQQQIGSILSSIVPLLPKSCPQCISLVSQLSSCCLYMLFVQNTYLISSQCTKSLL